MVEKLKLAFTEVYFTNISTTKGVEILAKDIGISKNSLRRFLGKLKAESNLRVSTLNLISQNLGYKNFHDFSFNHNRKRETLNFDLLGLYYGIVKGKGTKIEDPRFQNANYFFAEEVTKNAENLSEFVIRFADNQEALEYVLAWHPVYSRIADLDYQAALLKFAKISKKNHIKVFAHSFVYLGKFMSNNLTLAESEKSIKLLKKLVKKMRLDETEFCTFPETRFAVAEIIHAHKISENSNDVESFKKNVTEIFKNFPVSISCDKQIVYFTFVADILNSFEMYEEAHLCLQRLNLTEKLSKKFEQEFAYNKTCLFLYKVNLAMILNHQKKKKEVLKVFKWLSEKIADDNYFSFDSREFFQLKYYILAKKIFPAGAIYKENFDKLLHKTKFTFFNQN